VTIAKSFSLGKYEVTLGEIKLFVAGTKVTEIATHLYEMMWRTLVSACNFGCSHGESEGL
jgi:hypothetical protein